MSCGAVLAGGHGQPGGELGNSKQHFQKLNTLSTHLEKAKKS